MDLNLGKNRDLGQKWNFLLKNRNFRQKLQSWSKIEIEFSMVHTVWSNFDYYRNFRKYIIFSNSHKLSTIQFLPILHFKISAKW